MGLPFAHDAVDRHAFPAPNDDAIADRDLGKRDLEGHAAAHHSCALRLQPQQSLQCRGRTSPCPHFQELAQQHQRDHRRSGFEINVLVVETQDRHHGAQRPCHRRAQGDKYVHVGATAAQRMPRADIEATANPELYRRRQHELQPARQKIALLRAAPQHGQHRENQRQRQHGRGDKLALQSRVGSASACLVGSALRARVTPDMGPVADLLDGRKQRVAIGSPGVVTHPRRFGGKVDRGHHAGNAIERLFDARRTRGAGHALQREVNRRGSVFRRRRDGSDRFHPANIYPG